MSRLHYADSIVVARSPEALYYMVSDVTRMGEWKPVEAAHHGIPITLAAFKRAAEAG